MDNQQCPISRIASILGRKWMLELIYYLRERRRFCELQEVIGGVNPATLTARLKTLEREGFVRRHVVSQAPKHVAYELTEKGRDLAPVLNAIVEWVKRWHAEDFAEGEELTQQETETR